MTELPDPDKFLGKVGELMGWTQGKLSHLLSADIGGDCVTLMTNHRLGAMRTHHKRRGEWLAE